MICFEPNQNSVLLTCKIHPDESNWDLKCYYRIQNTEALKSIVMLAPLFITIFKNKQTNKQKGKYVPDMLYLCSMLP